MTLPETMSQGAESQIDLQLVSSNQIPFTMIRRSARPGGDEPFYGDMLRFRCQRVQNTFNAAESQIT